VTSSMWLSPTRAKQLPKVTATGVVEMDGERYPCVDGIFTLKRRPRAADELDQLMAAIVSGGRAGGMDLIANWACEEEPFDMTRLTRVYRPESTQPCGFVEDWTACCGSRDHYFIIRWACPSYLCALALLPRLVGGRLLDLACGVGHLAGLIAAFRPTTELYLADGDLLHLLVAKSYFAPRASLACIDFDEPLPLPDGMFDTVVISDALHYCENPEGLIAEALRVLNDNGELFVIHLHDPCCLTGEQVPGDPASRGKYLEWIRNADAEARILGATEAMLIANAADIDEAFTQDLQNESAGPYILRVIKNGGRGRDRRHLRLAASGCHLNAIYRDAAADCVEIEWPSEAFRLEFGHTPLPARIERRVLASVRQRGRLIRTGILVPDLPQ
jgi:SAM-dependent methyltransferase